MEQAYMIAMPVGKEPRRNADISGIRCVPAEVIEQLILLSGISNAAVDENKPAV